MKTKLFTLFIAGAALIGCSASKKAAKAKSQAPKHEYKVGQTYTFPSGLKFELLKAGNGAKADSGDIVQVNYVGKLTNDSVFDSSYKRKQPFQFVLGRGHVIKGWDEGVSKMFIGDSVRLTIPPQLGYGSRAMGSIPSNSTLVFDVVLLKVTAPPKPFDVAGKDTITTKDGLKYIIVKSNPQGEKIVKGDLATVNYSAFFTNGKMFGSSFYDHKPIVLKVGVGHSIKGMDEGLQLLRKGEKARLIIPYQLAYGERGYGKIIPPKSTLLFDVDVLNVEKGTPTK